MPKCITAHTKLDPLYPGYVNFTRNDDGTTTVIVRSDPKVIEDSSYICGYARDKGQPGRCTPGDENCNNYCNMAPSKGPMQDHPKACRQVLCGETVSLTLSEAEFDVILAGLMAAK